MAWINPDYRNNGLLDAAARHGGIPDSKSSWIAENVRLGSRIHILNLTIRPIGIYGYPSNDLADKLHSKKNSIRTMHPDPVHRHHYKCRESSA
jgi:hypothetical protein